MTTTITTHASDATRFAPRPGDHRFFSTMAVVTALTIIAGFSNTYGPKVTTGAPPVLPIIHVHAVVFVGWLALFVVQTMLVLKGKTAVHRRLGVAGVLLAALMLAVGSAAAVTVARDGHRGIPGVEFSSADGFLLLNLISIAVFAVLVAAAWAMRRNVQAHKRLMLVATAGVLAGPGVSRLPFVAGDAALIGPLVLAFLFAGPIYDLVTRRRLHPVYRWSVPLALVAIPPVVALLAGTGAWRSLAAMLIG